MIDRDSTNEFLMQFDGSAICVGGSAVITGGKTTFSSTNKKFGSGSYFSDSQLTGLGSPNPAFYQQRTPKSGYKRIEETDSRFTYQGNWTVSQGSANTYSGTTARFTANANASNFVAFNFTGTKLMIIGMPNTNAPTAVYIRIDDKIYTVNTRMSYLYCGCIFDITDLEDKEHMCYISSGNEFPLYFDAVDIDTNAELYPARAVDGNTDFYDRIRFESPAFNFGTNNFTISFWEYVVSGYPFWKGRLRINNHPSGFPAALLFGHTHNNGNLLLYMASEGATSWDMQNGVSLGAASYNQWVHWAITRQGNTFRVFKNGTQVLTFSSTLPLRSSGYSFIGIYEWSYNGQYYLDELYINNGTCLYSANFTPPTAPYEIDWGPPRDFSGLYLPDSENTAERISANVTGKELEMATGIKLGSYIGRELETFPGSKSRNHIGNELPIPNVGIRSRNHEARHLPIPEHATRLQSTFSGRELPITERGAKSRNHNGIPLDDTIPSVRLPHNFDGIPLEITPTSNAENKFNLIVTPTHLHKLPSVVITCESKSTLPLIGRCSLKIGNNDIITLNEDYEDVRHVNFTVTPSVLSTGNNLCRISYEYPDGEVEHLDFEIFKEEPKRLQVGRLFRHYEGGYDGERQNANVSLAAYPSFITPRDKSNTLIKTTEFTRISLSKYLAVQSVNVDAAGAKILVSFDEGGTWKTWGASGWETVNLENIAAKGMTPSVINSKTLADWSGIFKPKSLDFAVYLDNSISDYADPKKQIAMSTVTSGISVTWIKPGYLATNIYGTMNTSAGIPSSVSLKYSDGTTSNVTRASTYSVNFDGLINKCPKSIDATYASLNGNCAPQLAFLKSINVQITPNLKTGYAFII